MLREGPEAPGAPGALGALAWEAVVASAEASAAASGAGAGVAVGAGAEAAELAEARPRTRRWVCVMRVRRALGRHREGGPGHLLRLFLFQWLPVTKLGRLVKDMKIKSLEEIYLFSLPIKVNIVFVFLGGALAWGRGSFVIGWTLRGPRLHLWFY